MSEYLVKGETLTAIADAVRAKTGETDKLSLGAMADAITALDTNGINFKIIGGTTQPGGSNVGSGTTDTGDTLTYDGSMEDRVSTPCEAMGESTYAFKVSDVTPTIEDFANGYVVTFGGGSNGGITSDAFPAHTSGGKVIFADGYGFVAPSEFTDEEGKTCPKGTYFANFASTTQHTTDYLAILQIPGYTGFANNLDEEDPTVESIEENTIWINTDSEITSWVISKIKPSSPVEGMLWIYPEAPSQIKLNISNEIGAVETFPRLAYQYIGTKWVAKTAYSYINSEWRDWYYRLLTYTDQHTDVTGGWLLRPANGSTGTSVSGVSKTDTTGVGIAIKHTATNAFTSANLVTKNAIDLTDISKITFVITDYATNASASSQVQLMVHDKSYGTNASNAKYKVTKIISKNGTYTIDVSDLSGEYYVRLYSNTGVKTTTLQFTVSQVYCTWITP